MIVEPERYLDDFANAGADGMTVHVEASPHLHRTLQHIRSLGKRAGVVLNPSTHEDTIRYVLDVADLVLVMSVNPGFGGQAFIPEVLPEGPRHPAHDRRHRPARSTSRSTAESRPTPSRSRRRPGARVLVAGSAVFSHPPYADAIARLRKEGERGMGLAR